MLREAIDTASTLRAIARHPRLPRAELVRFQTLRLRRLVAHAYANVPYYRRLFDAEGIRPNDIRTLEDLSSIPITTRATLQGLPPEDTVARGYDPKRLRLNRTSGSSGEPFSIRRARREVPIFSAILLREIRYLGIRYGDRVARVNFGLPKRLGGFRGRTLARMLGAHRSSKIHCLLPVEEIIRQLCAIQPEVLGGYAGALARVAAHVGDAERDRIHPRLILSGSEVLTPAMRKQISDVFRAPLYDTYGCFEFGGVAWECKETGEYHVNDDGLILEVLSNGRAVEPGEQGEVIGTSLHAFAMPFIRYRLGDIVTRGGDTCGCGQPFSTIRNIQGRMIDYFKLPGGRTVHPYEILDAFEDHAYRWMRQYQLVQERHDLVVLRFVPKQSMPPEEMEQLRGRVRTVLGAGVEFVTLAVSDLELESNGKFRVLRSLVDSPYEGTFEATPLQKAVTEP